MGTLFLFNCGNSINNVKENKSSVSHIDTIELKNTPPVKTLVFEAIPDYDTTMWTEILETDSFLIDIRYATVNNFMKEQIYPCGRCFLEPNTAKALRLAVSELKSHGYSLILYDCYRPKPAQQKLWDIMPNASYVTPPSKGSMHNRGTAIDLSLVDIETGKVIEMGTEYDFFGKEAHFSYQGHSQEIIKRRHLLRSILMKYDFKGIRTEWWHFSYQKTLPRLSDWEWECE